jgi:cytochrome c oxidase subunit 1
VTDGERPHAGQTLEWLTSSPPPLYNFNAQYPIPKIRSFTPALDLRMRLSGKASQ